MTSFAPFFLHFAIREAAVELAQQLIRCPSVTPQAAGTWDILIPLLRDLGFHIEEVAFGSVTNLYARWGTQSPHLMFAGHVDVVPPGDWDAWTVSPFDGMLKDGFVWGRGVADMKGAIAAFVVAVQIFLERKFPRTGSISLLLTSDEEGPACDGTQKMIPWLKARGQVPDYCLIGEPTALTRVGDIIKIGRRGSVTGCITFYGIQGHIAYPHLADNPIQRVLATLTALSVPFDAGDDVFEASRLYVTSIDVDNPVTNITPAKVEVRFGVRYNVHQTADTVIARIHDLCRQMAGPYDLQVTCHGNAFRTSHAPWIQKVSDAIQATCSVPPKANAHGGTTDGRFLTAICPVVECGLPEGTIHHVDERVRVQDIETLTHIYAKILELTLSAGA